ncbi:MAG: Uncharacterized protein G01um101470_854 [Parcubacteria group bacterium Gr01-1014_70]|nr:MAG: Uncharacterized protein G01um101470_854 [Parcubacteria group bacterium Gr01-1014_70]
MEDLTKTQMILLVLLVSFVTSLTTVVVTVSILQEAQGPMEPQTVLQRVIQRVANEVRDGGAGGGQKEVVVIKEEDLIVEAVDRVSPAVVSIIATKDLPVMESGDDFFRQFFESAPSRPSNKTERREIGRGTGFIVSEDGYLITNRHVVEDEDAEYTAILNSGDIFKARVIARDPVHDVAIVKIDGAQFPSAPLGNSDVLKVGQTVVAIGNALGQFSNTVSVGIISGTERTLIAEGPGGQSELQHVLQTDAAINPGNSGGPLLDLNGKVIAINTAMVSGAENIGFAIPINVAVRDFKQARDTGRIVYPYIGVRYIVITEQLRDEKKLDADFGVLLIGEQGSLAVIPGSPAAVAGLKEGDIITRVDGVALQKDKSLGDAIQKRNVGDSIQLTVKRNGTVLTFNVKLAERPN